MRQQVIRNKNNIVRLRAEPRRQMVGKREDIRWTMKEERERHKKEKGTKKRKNRGEEKMKGFEDAKRGNRKTFKEEEE